jgi:hypothetical protein
MKISRLIEDKFTYPNWNSNAAYPLQAKESKSNIEVYYIVKGNRKVGRQFPKEIDISSSFSYALGLLKGEGSNSLGKSNYRRFTITNSDPRVIRFLVKQLESAGLLSISELKEGSFHLLHHTATDNEAIEYWSKPLNLPESFFKCFDDKTKTTPYGVCHVYLSDVLLRRVIDLLHELVMNASTNHK